MIQKFIKTGLCLLENGLENPDLVVVANRLFLKSKIKGVLFLLNKIGNPGTESYLRAKLAEAGIKPDGVIHEDRSISMSWLK